MSNKEIEEISETSELEKIISDAKKIFHKDDFSKLMDYIGHKAAFITAGNRSFIIQIIKEEIRYYCEYAKLSL